MSMGGHLVIQVALSMCNNNYNKKKSIISWREDLDSKFLFIAAKWIDKTRHFSQDALAFYKGDYDWLTREVGVAYVD